VLWSILNTISLLGVAMVSSAIALPVAIKISITANAISLNLFNLIPPLI